MAKSMKTSEPRLVFDGQKQGVKYKNRSSISKSPKLNGADDERSSVDSTAGRGHYIYSNKSDFTFKVVFLGDASVGKTCLASLLVHRKVAGLTQNTIGFDHHIKEMIVGGVPISLNVWDTAGMEQFRNALIQQYYRNVSGIVFVYDITRQETFDSVDNWYMESRQYSENSERIKMSLIGNQKDKETQREVTEEAGRRYAESRGMLFAEMSAKDINCLDYLDDLILQLSHQMLVSREENSFTRSMSNVIHLREEDWELVEIPKEPIPIHLYQDQDRGMSLRNQLTSSVRGAVTNGRGRCKC